MFRYEEIFNNLCIRIDNGEFNGRLFPTENNLADEYGVSRITIRSALDKLEKEGKIERRPGKGTYLSQPGENKKKTIGVLLCKADAAFGLDILLGIEKQAEKEGYLIILKLSYDNHEKEEKMLNELVDAGVDGIILQGCHGNFTKAVMNLAGKDFPLVSVDRVPPKIPISSVSTDNLRASYELTDYLCCLGHKNFVFVSTPPSFASSIEKRIEGFKKYCIEHSLPASDDRFVIDITSPATQTEKDRQADKAAVRRYLSEHPEVTAIIASERRVALIVQEIIDEMHLNCPENYSIACFYSEPVFGKNTMIPHVRQNQEELGKKSVSLLVNRIKNDCVEEHILIPATICPGSTTARPRK